MLEGESLLERIPLLHYKYLFYFHSTLRTTATSFKLLLLIFKPSDVVVRIPQCEGQIKVWFLKGWTGMSLSQNRVEGLASVVSSVLEESDISCD